MGFSTHRRRWLITAAVLGVVPFSGSIRADTTAEWTSAISGNWIDPSNWSTNPNAPNNGTPAGTNYAALIDLPGAGPYTVTLTNDVAVDGLTIDTANATFNHNMGTLTVGALNIEAGKYTLSGGTLSGGIAGATVTNSSGNPFNVFSGTLDHLRFTGSSISMSRSSGGLLITNGLDLAGNSLDLSGINDQLIFDGTSQSVDNLSIDIHQASSQVLVGGPRSTGPVTLTLGVNATLHGAGTVADSTAGTETLVNNGTISADLAQQVLAVNASNFTNNGSVAAVGGARLSIGSANWTNTSGGTITANASTLSLAGAWSNGGTITASNASTVNLGGSFAAADLSGYSPSANTTTNLTGTLDNTAHTFSLGGFAGTWNLNGGKISGGTVSLGSPSALNILGGTLDSTTIDSTTTLNIASGGTLALTGNWVNQGTINVGTATLSLGGNLTLGSLSGINSGNGTIDLAGMLALASTDTLSLDGSTGTWVMTGGTVQGGTVAFSNNQTLHIQSGTLDRVRISGGNLTMDQANSVLTVKDGLTVDSGNLAVTGNSAAINFDGNQTLDSLNINCSPTTASKTISVFVGGPSSSGPVTLTLGSNAILHGTAKVKDFTGVTGTLVNNGTINADINGRTLSIGTSTFTNNASLEATNGGILALNASSWTNLGTISATSSTVDFGGNFTLASIGTLSAAGSTLNITGTLNLGANETFAPTTTNGSWAMAGGTIKGGTVNLAASQNLTVTSGTLDGVSLTGADVNLNSFGAALNLRNGLSAADQNINLNGQSSTVDFDGGSQTIDNITINSTTSLNTALIVGGASSSGPLTVTLGPKVTIEGYQHISSTALNGAVANETLVNNGLVTSNGAAGASGEIDISVGNVVNNASMQATQGNVLNVTSPNFTNNATVSTAGGFAFINAQNWTNAAGASITATSGGALSLAHTWTNAAGATISASNGTLDMEGSWSNAGTITADSSTVYLGGTMTPASLGSLTLTNCTVHQIGTLNLGTSTLTLPTSGGSWIVDTGGTINGGTFVCNGESFHVANTNATIETLNGFHLVGSDLNLDGPGLDVMNGLTVDTKVVKGSGEILSDGVSQTFDNLTMSGSFTLEVGGTSAPSSPTLILGTNLTLNGSPLILPFNNTPGTTAINNGVINGGPTVRTSVFTNNGAINLSAGDQLSIGQQALFTNNGTINIPFSASISQAAGAAAGSLVNNGSIVTDGFGTIGPITGTGSLTVDNGLQITAGASTQNSLSVGSGQLDLTSGSFDIHYGAGASPDAAVRNWLITGYNQGKWFGSGIASSTAAGDPTHHSLGYADGADNIAPGLAAGDELIKYTFAGDANLDGKVDVSDLGILATNYGHLTGQRWDQADFTYDGGVDVSDLGVLATNYGAGTGVTGAAAAAMFQADLKLVEAEDPAFAAAVGAVPEPTGVSLMALALARIYGRRRRKRV